MWWFFQNATFLADFENLVPNSQICWTPRPEFNGLLSAHGQDKETYRWNPPLKSICRLEIQGIFCNTAPTLFMVKVGLWRFSCGFQYFFSSMWTNFRPNWNVSGSYWNVKVFLSTCHHEELGDSLFWICNNARFMSVPFSASTAVFIEEALFKSL